MSKIQIRKRLTPDEANLIDFVRGSGNLPEGIAIKHDGDLAKLKRENENLSKKYRESLIQLESEKQKNLFLSGFDEKELKLCKPFEMPLVSNSSSESVAVAIASDWHFEELVTSGQTAGINEFNLGIARKRAELFFQHLFKLIYKLRNTTKINSLVLAILGDLISGYIHDELMENNELSPIEATLEVYKVLKSGIELIIKKSNLEQIIIPCCVGNHARTTKKFQWSSAYRNSYEYIIYSLLVDYFSKYPNVKVILPEGYHVILDMDGYIINMSHGNAIGYMGGLGGLYIPANRIIKEYQDAYLQNHGKRLNLCLFAHHHVLLVDRANNWASNGSLIGYNSYGSAKGFRYQRPQQAFMLINKKWGLTFETPIFLEDK